MRTRSFNSSAELPLGALDAVLRSATSVCAVGSTHDDVPGFHGHPFRLRSRSAFSNPTLAAARLMKFDSTPADSSSHLTPCSNGPPNSPRTVARVTHSAVPQPAIWTSADGRHAPFAICQDLSNVHARSASGWPWSAIVA